MSTHNAFLFVKPHAADSEAAVALVESMLNAAGITVTSSGVLEASVIDEKKLIDVHYGAIAKRAVLLQPNELVVTDAAAAKFEAAFGLPWAAALAQEGAVVNALGAATKLGLNPTVTEDVAALQAAWAAIPADKLVKFGGGFYLGEMVDPEGGKFYAVNVFYINMRALFTVAPAKLKWYTVMWPVEQLSWADFRGKVLGATNPAQAAEGSVRRAILDQWQSLGLAKEPYTSENGVHASASPIEALFERMNWLGVDPATDVYGAELLAAGLPSATLLEWAGDPTVSVEGVQGSLFDALEDMNVPDCTAKAVAIWTEQQASPEEPGAASTEEGAVAPNSPSGSGMNAVRALSETAETPE